MVFIGWIKNVFFGKELNRNVYILLVLVFVLIDGDVWLGVIILWVKKIGFEMSIERLQFVFFVEFMDDDIVVDFYCDYFFFVFEDSCGKV